MPLNKNDAPRAIQALNDLIDEAGHDNLIARMVGGQLSIDCDVCEEGINIPAAEGDSPEKFIKDHAGCEEWQDYSRDPWMSGEIDYDGLGA